MDNLCPVTNISYLTLRNDENNELLVGWVDMARGFVHTVMKEAPFTLIMKYVNGNKTFDSGEDALEILETEKGFLACLIFALIFVITMFFSSFCVCCFRCGCGKCGGGNYQRRAKNVRCRRQTYIVWLFTCLVCISVGLACTVLSIDKCFQTVDKSEDTILGVLNNTKNFVSNTLEDINCLMEIGVDHAIEKTRNRMNDIKNQDGERLKNNFENILVPLERECNAVDEDIELLKSDIFSLKMGLEKLSIVNWKVLNDDQEKLRDDFEKFIKLCPNNVCVKLETSSLNISFPSSYNKHFVDTDEAKIDTINRIKFTTKYDQAIKRLNDVPKEAEDNSKKLRNEIDEELKKIKNTLNGKNDILDSFKDVKKRLDTVFDDASDLIIKNIDGSEKYVEYSHYSNLVLKLALILILIPTLLWFFGLISGIFGHGDDHYLKTKNRGCISNCGGVMLMVGAYLFFLFSILTMLYLAVIFQIGGHAQVYVCQPLMDDGFESLNEFYRVAAEKMEHNVSKNLIPSQVVIKCKENRPIVEALNLENDVRIELEKFLDLKKQTDVEKLNNSNIFDFGTLVDDFEKFQKLFLETNLDKIEELTKIKSIETYQDDLNKMNANIDEILPKLPSSDEREALEKLQIRRREFSKKLPISSWNNTYNFATLITKSMETAKGAVDSMDVPGLKIELENIVTKAINDYVKAVLEPGENYIELVITRVTKDIAKCGILYETFDVGRKLLCRDILDPFNGYWFGIGWCLFFEFFGLVAAIKLSKHFYRMSKEDKLEVGYVAYEGQDGRDFVAFGSGERMGYPMKERGHYDNGGFREHR